MRRFAIAVDTGAGSSFIKIDELHHLLCDKIEPLGDDVVLRKGSGKPIFFPGNIVLTVQPGNSVEKVRSFVADKLATPVIFGCDYCDLQVRLFNLASRSSA